MTRLGAWLIADMLFIVINLAGLVFAAAGGEPRHAGVHAAAAGPRRGLRTPPIAHGPSATPPPFGRRAH